VGVDMATLSGTLKVTREEFLSHRETMKHLNSVIDQFRSELKATKEFNQKSFQDLSKILFYVNDKLKAQGEQLATLGRVIFKDWPEGK
jgi:septal ring factor EnvC (AmiA/AmiB activator)